MSVRLFLTACVCEPETERDHLIVPANGRVQTDFFRPTRLCFRLRLRFLRFLRFSRLFSIRQLRLRQRATRSQ